jgi:hypothetical protein
MLPSSSDAQELELELLHAAPEDDWTGRMFLQALPGLQVKRPQPGTLGHGHIWEGWLVDQGLVKQALDLHYVQPLYRMPQPHCCEKKITRPCSNQQPIYASNSIVE